MADELISIGFRYIRRAEVASNRDVKYWVEIQDKRLAQQALEFIETDVCKCDPAQVGFTNSLYGSTCTHCGKIRTT